MTATAVKADTKMDADSPVNISPGGGGNSVNNRGPKRKRGGGPQGPGRNNFGGGRGGGGGGDRRQNFRGSNEFDGPINKKQRVGGQYSGGGDRVFDKLRAIQGSSADLPSKKFEIKKFIANTRLYIGNIPNEANDQEIKDLFTPYGEIDELFVNREKNFAFLKLDYRTNAEKARAELDQRQIKGRAIKVRFAPATVRLRVKNLGAMVSNELLEMAFSIFGDIERALVFVDEKGKSVGEGIVDFTRKNNALNAHKYCSDKCFFLTSDPRPVITEIGDMYEMDEGLLEVNLPKREYKDRELVYYKAREIGPRFAEDGTFEHEYGSKWKSLVQEIGEKEKALKEELQKELDKLQAQMEMARYDHETEMLRRQLRQREIDQERHKVEWEQRRANFGPGGPRGPPEMAGVRDVKMEGPVDGENIGGQLFSGLFDDGPRGGFEALAPPPMPPQGLMAHLQGNQAGPGPAWESGPFFSGGGNFGGQQLFRNDGPPRGNDGPRFMGPRGGRGGNRGGNSFRGRSLRR